MRTFLVRPRDESGVAMILVVLVALLMLAAALLAADLTDASITGSGRHVTYERELHLAEEGIDQALARLQANDAYVTTTATAPAVTATEDEEMAWALAQFASSSVQAAPDGSFTFVKPTGRNVVYAAGWDRTKAGPSVGRILKAEYLFSTYHPEGAIVAGGDLELGGSAGVGGILGDVHSNGDIDIDGNSVTVTGDITASETIDGSAGGTQTQGAPRVSLPPVDPLEMWALLSPNNAGSWYDLCSDGTAHAPGGGAPCLGALLYDANGATQGFRGWTWKSTTRTWQKDGSGEYSGVYFIHEANAEIGKSPGSAENPWRATVITASRPISGVCQSLYGDISLSGGPVMTGFIDGLALVAGRDLKLTGNTQQVITGVLAAHEQIYASGSTSLYGSLLAESACNTTGSLVDSTESFVGGSMSITYDDNVDVQLGNLIRTSLWLEL